MIILREYYRKCILKTNCFVDPDHPSNEPDIFLEPRISKIIKPYQIGGIRFMYEKIIRNNAGCILAHSMGKIVESFQNFSNFSKISTRNYRPRKDTAGSKFL